MSGSLWLHQLRHTRLPCPSHSPGVCSNLCPLSWWCHPTTSSSVVPISFCLQSFPASGSFPMRQLFTSDGQSLGASASVLPMNIQGWFPGGSDSEESACNAWDLDSIPGSAIFPVEGNGNPFKYSCLKNPKNKGAWLARVQSIAKNRTQLSDYTSISKKKGKWNNRKMRN